MLVSFYLNFYIVAISTVIKVNSYLETSLII